MHSYRFRSFRKILISESVTAKGSPLYKTQNRVPLLKEVARSFRPQEMCHKEHNTGNIIMNIEVNYLSLFLLNLGIALN